MGICVQTVVENMVRVTIGAPLCLADMLGIPNGIIATLNQVRKKIISFVDTGKSLSEALIFESTNPQYGNRLFTELRVQYMKISSSKHVENML